ncbi:KilA-N domain-containing protein [Agrobacterium rosae]|uniref:KilA-N domain-containing protein n=1 Tax=Agrobacterium rosae TaxID=1972867 RepID=A0AAW9FHT8_9HYPH|nr:KilA-N domain-containing protein [Agrobacterium rosae]MDX8304122.1 KilA-N domain-containing protein [Agrobacterium rosae]
MTDAKSSLIRLRGVLVEEDDHGHWNLNDIWLIAKGKTSQEPKHWRDIGSVKKLTKELQKKVTAGYLKENKPNIPVIYAKTGRGNAGTFAHPILAAAYAGYLSPKLEIETREVWLRFRSGDVSLADEILQRASPEDNQWAGVRALSRAKRNEFTSVLQAHGVVGAGYGQVTNAVYSGLFGADTQMLKAEKGVLTKSGSLRDAMDTDELVSVMFAESLSRKKIVEGELEGNVQCLSATKRSTAFVKQAIDANNASGLSL